MREEERRSRAEQTYCGKDVETERNTEKENLKNTDSKRDDHCSRAI